MILGRLRSSSGLKEPNASPANDVGAGGGAGEEEEEVATVAGDDSMVLKRWQTLKAANESPPISVKCTGPPVTSNGTSKTSDHNALTTLNNDSWFWFWRVDGVGSSSLSCGSSCGSSCGACMSSSCGWWWRCGANGRPLRNKGLLAILPELVTGREAKKPTRDGII